MGKRWDSALCRAESAKETPRREWSRRNGLSLLLAYYNFRVTNHFVVEEVAGLHAVDHMVLLLLLFGREKRHGFVEVGVKGRVGGVHFLETLLLERAHELLEDERKPLAECGDIVALRHIGLGALHIVEDGEQLLDHFLAAVEHQFGVSGHAVLAEIGKISGLSQDFVLQFGNFCLCCGELFGFCGFCCRSFALGGLAGGNCGFCRLFGRGRILYLCFGLGGIEVLFFHNCLYSFDPLSAISVPKEGQMSIDQCVTA